METTSALHFWGGGSCKNEFVNGCRLVLLFGNPLPYSAFEDQSKRRLSMKGTLLLLISFAAFVLSIEGLPVFGQESEEREFSRERLQEQRSDLQHSQEERQLQNPSVGGIRSSAIQEIRRILEEKMSRTPAQQKLDSHLHLAGQAARGVL